MSEKVEVVVAIGTRPDVLKMEPVITKLREAEIEHRVWWSGQGGDIQPDIKWENYECETQLIEYGTCHWDDSLSRNIAITMLDFEYFLQTYCPSLVLVHGDDATAYACALAAHALDIPVGHIEAGMRTYERDPWPEEQFRQVIARLASLHFAPSEIEAGNLYAERINGAVHVVGNTINDVLARSHKFGVLVTCHRRENALERTQLLLDALSEFQAEWPDRAEVTVIKHPNWQNRYNLPQNLDFVDPIRDHGEFVELMRRSDVVVTDSGGLQEECAFLGVDCIVYREQTERKSLFDVSLICLMPEPDEVTWHLTRKISNQHVYGLGDAAEKIVEIVKVWLNVHNQRKTDAPDWLTKFNAQYTNKEAYEEGVRLGRRQSPKATGGRRAAEWARLENPFLADHICKQSMYDEMGYDRKCKVCESKGDTK